MKKKIKQRNPLAMALRSPHLRPQVVPNKKAYKRKGRGANLAPD